MEEYKICLMCGKKFFKTDKNNKVFKIKKCCDKNCSRNYWRKTHREEYLEKSKIYNNKVMNTPSLYKNRLASAKRNNQTFKRRIYHIKKGAVDRGYSFNLSDEFLKYFWNKPCHYCGKEISGIGIDRIDNSIGYEENNCTSCCSTCNMMKKNLTLKDFFSHIKQIYEHSDLKNYCPDETSGLIKK